VRRALRPRNVASFLLALAVLYLVYQELLGLDWREPWTTVRGASAGLFALAFAVFYCSYPLRALRWRVLLANAGYGRGYTSGDGRPIPSIFGLTRIMYLAWFANCITVARLGEAYRAYLLKRAAGVSFAVTLGTVLAERVLDLAVLAAMMGAGVLAVSFLLPSGSSSLPPEVLWALAVGLILSSVAVAGLLAMRSLRGAVEWALPKRLHGFYARLEHGVVGSIRGELALLVDLSAAGWAIEVAALYGVAEAVGAPVPVAGALMVALAASLLLTVPFTPGGLGFTEAGMVVLLQWLGLDLATAGAVTLLFRLINYWSIVVLGSVLYVSFRDQRRLAESRKE